MAVDPQCSCCLSCTAKPLLAANWYYSYHSDASSKLSGQLQKLYLLQAKALSVTGRCSGKQRLAPSNTCSGAKHLLQVYSLHPLEAAAVSLPGALARLC